MQENIPDLTGKVAVVTGASTRIAYEAAKALNVTIVARDMQKPMAVSTLRIINGVFSLPPTYRRSYIN